MAHAVGHEDAIISGSLLDWMAEEMTPAAVSVVLPIGDRDDALVDILRGYAEALDELVGAWELLLVPEVSGENGRFLEQLTSINERISLTGAARGWGAGVSAGLRASSGQTICYTNWRRTSVKVLAEMLDLALRNPGLVLRANRRTRDTRVQRLGSLLFNVECRLLLQIPAWDVNGTPKVFPRAFGKLLELRREDELFDAEFALVCERSAYPVIEVPIEAGLLSHGPSHVDLGTAVRMYLGVARLRARSLAA